VRRGSHDARHLERDLVEAELAITVGLGRIENVRRLLAEFDHDGLIGSADATRALLDTLEDSFRLRIEERDLIMRGLDAARAADLSGSEPAPL
jgi:hypothetical protein